VDRHVEARVEIDRPGVATRPRSDRARTPACLSIGWGGGLLGKSAYLNTGDDSYRKIVRQSPLLGRAVQTGMPFPKTRAVIFEGNQPASLPAGCCWRSRSMQIEIQYWLPTALNFLTHLIVVPITGWLLLQNAVAEDHGHSCRPPRSPRGRPLPSLTDPPLTRRLTPLGCSTLRPKNRLNLTFCVVLSIS
jgi:hypothetical protein